MILILGRIQNPRGEQEDEGGKGGQCSLGGHGGQGGLGGLGGLGGQGGQVGLDGQGDHLTKVTLCFKFLKWQSPSD